MIELSIAIVALGLLTWHQTNKLLSLKAKNQEFTHLLNSSEPTDIDKLMNLVANQQSEIQGMRDEISRLKVTMINKR